MDLSSDMINTSHDFGTTCKDCNQTLRPKDIREVMDNGDILCEDCVNESDRAAQADWQMKENIIKGC